MLFDGFQLISNYPELFRTISNYPEISNYYFQLAWVISYYYYYFQLSWNSQLLFPTILKFQNITSNYPEISNYDFQLAWNISNNYLQLSWNFQLLFPTILKLRSFISTLSNYMSNDFHSNAFSIIFPSIFFPTTLEVPTLFPIIFQAVSIIHATISLNSFQLMLPTSCQLFPLT